MNTALFKKTTNLLAIILLPLSYAQAMPITPATKPFLDQIATNTSIISALQKHAQTTKHISHYRANKLNKIWRQQMTNRKQPLIKPIINNPLARQLAGLVRKSHGQLDAIWILDNQGFSLAQSKMLSRYWFGDLAVWKKSIHAKPGHWYIGERHKLYGQKIRAISLSIPIVNQQKKVIGVLAADEIIGNSNNG